MPKNKIKCRHKKHAEENVTLSTGENSINGKLFIQNNGGKNTKQWK